MAQKIALLIAITIVLVSTCFSQAEEDDTGFVPPPVDYRAVALANMHDPDPAIRLRAIGSLNSYYSDQVAEAWIDALDDPDEKVRVAAIDSLGHKKARSAVSKLIPLLSEESVLLRARAAWALGMIGDTESVEPLLLALARIPKGQKFPVIEALGMLNDPRAVQPLIALRGTDDGEFARNALGSSAVETLCDMLASPNLQDRWYASMTLERIADERALEPLIKTFGDVNSFGDIAGRAIALRIGVPAIPRLIDELRNSNPRARIDAIKSLTGIRDPRTTDAILGATGDGDENVRLRAIEALVAKLNEGYPSHDGGYLIFKLSGEHPPAVAALFERMTGALIIAMDDKNAAVRLSAVKGVSGLDGKDIIPALVAKLDDRDVGLEAAIALGVRTDATGMVKLFAALRGEDAGNAMRASWALTRIGLPAVDGLIAVLKDRNPEFPLRQRKYIEEHANDWCDTGRGDPDLDPRSLAARALGGIGDERARGPLIDATKDSSEWLKRAAKQALAQLDKS